MKMLDEFIANKDRLDRQLIIFDLMIRQVTNQGDIN